MYREQMMVACFVAHVARAVRFGFIVNMFAVWKPLDVMVIVFTNMIVGMIVPDFLGAGVPVPSKPPSRDTSPFMWEIIYAEYEYQRVLRMSIPKRYRIIFKVKKALISAFLG